MHKLTDKQEIFCHEYLIDFNAKQAALRAGYSKSSAHVSGHRNLKHWAVAARLQELIEERKARLGASADYVLERLLEIDSLDISQIVDSQGNVLPLEQWNRPWRRSIASIDIAEVKSAQAVVKKIKLPDKLKVLEMIGKHIDVSAFREKMESTGVDGRELVINVMNPQTKKDIRDLEKSPD